MTGSLTTAYGSAGARRTVRWGLAVCVLVVGLQGSGALERNWANLVIGSAWLQTAYDGPKDERLEDDIPDGWSVSNWGASRAQYTLDRQAVHGGERSELIRKTNPSDFAVVDQTFLAKAETQLGCSAYHRGDEGFALVRSEQGKTLSFTRLASGSEWTRTEWWFDVGDSGGPLTLFMGLGGRPGVLWVDDVSCVVKKAQSRNLVRNGGFEEDGMPVDPWIWWRAHAAVRMNRARVETAARVLQRSAMQTLGRINVLLASDLLLGRSRAVAERAAGAPKGCLAAGAEAFLLGLGPAWQREGGAMAQEKIVKLAMALLPECPQAYANLGALYEEHRAYFRAATLYGEAAERSAPGPQRGGYRFRQGALEVTALGDWAGAVEALSEAARNSGWEPAAWYHGAAEIYLGDALRGLGRCSEARQAYERVLKCADCSTRHADARAAIGTVGSCQQ